ncbi:histidine phosphatase family protein [Oceanobacillus halophilus]|uniref:Histidine phosphatase family protein n=1 Tax=Oceanobacillus halophilus TaxID=930130 RepID=A0A495A1Y1_9BACI|nr:histidine phosphatase family protein [Oceanobacillus halophilus]RKQ32939.1 histidine phosphatase family protein [Oceanobacillus halophilus]
MTTICFIRHGETDWNSVGRLQGRADIPLNHNGRKQANLCGSFLKNTEYDLLITSPLKRAKETADIINSHLNLPFIVMDNFIERSFGDAEGMTYEERRNKYPETHIPNQEEQSIFLERIMKALEEVNQAYPNKRILLISHGAVINAILSTLSEGKIGTKKTPLMNGCLSNIHYVNEQWKIKDYNQNHHLE